MHTLRILLFILSLFSGLSCLCAQHTLRLDSLGVSVDFPCEAEERPSKQALEGVEQYFYMCTGDDRNIYMLSLMTLPELEESAEGLQGRMEAIMNSYTEPSDISYKRIQATAHSAEMELHYVSRVMADIPMRVRVLYRAGRLLEIRYSVVSGNVNEETWNRISGSLKTDW